MRPSFPPRGTPWALAHTLVASLAVLTTACLAPGRGSVEDATDTGGDTVGDTSTSDTDPDTREIHDTDDACSGLSCDDQDPCTFDFCEAGVCQHVRPDVAQMPRPECVDNSDCDDGDPCTDDFCAGTDGACQTTPFCRHEPRVGCVITGCDLDLVGACADGDPCTLDRCDPSGGCLHEPVGEGLCERACNPQEALMLSDLRFQPDNSEVHVTGAIVPPVCKTDAFPCTVQPALGDGAETVTLYGDRAGTCTVADAQTTTCDPMVVGAHYVVWGQTRADAFGLSPGNADAVPVIPPMPGLDVTGYCLDVTSLGGAYRGVLSIEGEEVLVFAAVITPRDNSPLLTMTNVQVTSTVWGRIDTAAFAAQAPTLSVDEGRVALALKLPWLNATPEVENVTLFSTAEMLVGPIGPFFLSPASGADQGAAEDTVPLGELRLVPIAR